MAQKENDVHIDEKPFNIREEKSFEDQSNCFSVLLFNFLNPILRSGYKKPLQQEDLGGISRRDDPEKLYNKFSVIFGKSLKAGKPKLLSSLVGSTGRCAWFSGIFLYFIALLLMLVPSMILQLLVQDLTAQEDADTNKWLLVLGLVACYIISALLTSYGWLVLSRLGVQMRSMASEALYQKALRLSSASKANTDSGKIINLMSTDCTTLQMFPTAVATIIGVPFLLVGSIIMLVNQIGKLTWWVFGVFILVSIFQMIGGGFAMGIRQANLMYTDRRIKLLNEVITGIRVIKYYCWEKPFLKKINTVREQELKKMESLSWIVYLLFNTVLSILPFCLPLLIFLLYPSTMGEPLTPSVVFTTISLISVIKMPFMMLPMCLVLGIQFAIAVKRINAYLILPDVDPSIVYRNVNKDQAIEYETIDKEKKVLDHFDNENIPILIKDGYFAWGNEEPVLNNINIEVPKGSLVAVVGKVGCGKTSFVSSILGEMTKTAGIVCVNGTISYCTQQAWLLSASVKENILFGKPFDQERYKKAIEYSCLQDDLKVLKGGDECEIGDNGINLSGGQKMRIVIARCYYSNTDIMILDDPIAAVDSHVGQSIFNKCICKGMAGKTRILVTNAVQYLSKCDKIIVLNDNKIEAQGTFDEIKAMNIDISSLLAEKEGTTRNSMKTSERNSGRSSSKDTSTTHTNTNNNTNNNSIEDGELVEEEEKQSGRIPMKTYGYYIKSSGVTLVILFLLVSLAAYILNTVVLFTLSSWKLNTTSITEECQNSMSYYSFRYGYLVLAMTIAFILYSVFYVPATIRCSRTIHKELSTAIMKAPTSFFDVTPIGRILNRFNKDIDNIDHLLPDTVAQLLQMTWSLLMNIIQIGITTMGLMVLPLLILIAIFYYLQLYFRRSNTELQRLEAVSRSPVFSSFQSILNGAPTIRAYNHQQRFINGLEDKLAVNNHDSFIFNISASWLQIRTNIIIGIANGCIAAFSIVFRTLFSPGLLGIALTSSFEIESVLLQFTLQIAQLEAKMNSIERIKYYVDNIQPEEDSTKTMIIPEDTWPTEGAIQFDNLEMRYRNGPKVLKGVTMSISSKEKVGVVGRTGAGKSSLIVALFRMSECCGGHISIDGVNLNDISLEDVRKHLCLIPQDPVLFCESIRYNIDPFDECTDEEIWNALDNVCLKQVVEDLPNKLLEIVAEGGSNFSVGQRQLICMARAILRKPKVLIMDEATASLDNETDSILQTMIRKQFINCTVLTIAHRLNTIMDSDRVCVMDKGIVAEFDTPLNLLNKPNSIFSGMVAAANNKTLYDMVPGYKH
ncbi:hypothetical protein WA158_000590 [Blastocystis sp. Blastoise]